MLFEIGMNQNLANPYLLDKTAFHLGQLIVTLASAIPGKHGVLSELAQKQADEINAIRKSIFDPKVYFSGNGPVATRYKQHLTMCKESGSLSLAKQKAFQLKIDEFNYSPLYDCEVSKLCYDQLTQYRADLRKDGITSITSLPAITIDSKLESLESGIYSGPVDPEDLALVLRIKAIGNELPELLWYAPEGVPGILLARHAKEEMWIDLTYAPEKIVCFNGMHLRMDQEYKKVIKKAKQLVKNYKFDAVKEIDLLQVKMHDLLTKCDSFPKGIRYFNNNKAEPSIAVPVDDVCLYFFYSKDWNVTTRSFFKQTGTIKESEVPKNKLIEIVNYGKVAIEYLTNVINNNESQINV
jgi:hypothetical protein